MIHPISVLFEDLWEMFWIADSWNIILGSISGKNVYMIVDFYYKFLSSYLFNTSRKDRNGFVFNTILGLTTIDFFIFFAICVMQNAFGYRSIGDFLDSLVDDTGISQIDAVPVALPAILVFALLNYLTLCPNKRYLAIMRKYRYDDKRICIYALAISILLFILSVVLFTVLKD